MATAIPIQQTGHLSRRASLLAFALVLACTGQPDTPAHASDVAWRVIDTTWAPSWDAKADSVPTYLIAVEARGVTDTLTHVIEPSPFAIGDSALVGLRLRFESGGPAASREIFRLELPAKRLRSWAIPSDVWYFFRELAISPDGGSVAYVAGQPQIHAVVRRIESDSVVVRSPLTEPCECDVDRHHARWVAADSFEIAVWGATPQGGWLLVAGRTRPNRVTLDTLLEEPRWRAQSSPP